MFERIAEYTANTLDIDVEEITRDTTLKSLGLGSLDVVEMIEDLENELGVEISLDRQEITTMGEMADYIEEQVN